MNKSDSIQAISTALAAFQSEIHNPKNTENNPFFNRKYAPLDEILNIARPLLSKHGLSFTQWPDGDGQNITIHSMLMHSSGEWIEFDPLTLKADKATAQGAGSAITYGRRYAISAILGIASEDDDDGNHASGKQPKGQNKQTDAAEPADKPPGGLTDAQIKRAYAIGGKKGKTADDIKKWAVKVCNKDLKDLTKPEYDKMIAKLEELPNE